MLEHPMAQRSLATLPDWGVIVVPPETDEGGPRLAETRRLLAAVAGFVGRG